MIIVNKSIWDKYLEINKEKKKIKEKETDILIIGGGIIGVTLAYYLRNSREKIKLFESKYYT